MTYLPPTFPLRGEIWLECPITGWRFPESQGRWRKGRLVHPLAYDEFGYRESITSERPPRRLTTRPEPRRPVPVGGF